MTGETSLNDVFVLLHVKLFHFSAGAGGEHALQRFPRGRLQRVSEAGGVRPQERPAHINRSELLLYFSTKKYLQHRNMKLLQVKLRMWEMKFQVVKSLNSNVDEFLWRNLNHPAVLFDS